MKKVVFLMLFGIIMSIYGQEKNNRIDSKGYAAHSVKGEFAPFKFTRHGVGDNDILIDILYSGICHSDIHHVYGHWKENEPFPFVPGHEMVGVVSKVGKNVNKFKLGDYAGVGCLVNACGDCDYCEINQEQYCDKRVLTYGSKDSFHDGELTNGGYSNNIVISEKFAIKVDKSAKLEKVAPLLCAGITVYSPINFLKIKKGDKVGVAGFGGLGHMAVQYAVKLGAEVYVFDRTELKREDALRFGAVRYINVNKAEDLGGLNNSLNYIINTISAKHDANMYVKMLKYGGEMAYVGLPSMSEMPTISIATLVFDSKRKVFGSQIGGIKETQEMLDYSIKNNIYPEVEIISAENIEAAYKKVVSGEVKFRYVIDIKTIK